MRELSPTLQLQVTVLLLDWMETAYRLDVPVFADVLHAALRPQLIRECNLKQHLNAAARVLDWVDRPRFAAAFDGDAIRSL